MPDEVLAQELTESFARADAEKAASRAAAAAAEAEAEEAAAAIEAVAAATAATTAEPMEMDLTPSPLTRTVPLPNTAPAPAPAPAYVAVEASTPAPAPAPPLSSLPPSMRKIQTRAIDGSPSRSTSITPSENEDMDSVAEPGSPTFLRGSGEFNYPNPRFAGRGDRAPSISSVASIPSTTFSLDTANAEALGLNEPVLRYIRDLVGEHEGVDEFCKDAVATYLRTHKFSATCWPTVSKLLCVFKKRQEFVYEGSRAGFTAGEAEFLHYLNKLDVE